MDIADGLNSSIVMPVADLSTIVCQTEHTNRSICKAHTYVWQLYLQVIFQVHGIVI